MVSKLLLSYGRVTISQLCSNIVITINYTLGYINSSVISSVSFVRACLSCDFISYISGEREMAGRSARCVILTSVSSARHTCHNTVNKTNSKIPTVKYITNNAKNVLERI